MKLSSNKIAIIWNGLGRYSNHFIQFIVTLVLARLLLPADYAVVAILTIFISISYAFIDGGFIIALVQSQSVTQKDYSTIFYLNVVVSILFYLGLFIAAPWIEDFYNYPDLAIVTRVYCLSIVIQAFGLIPRTIINKNIAFKQLAIISIVSSIITSIVAIAMAYVGLKYWVLVAQSLLSTTLSTIMIYVQAKWKPSLVFSIDSVKKHALFGMRILFVYLFHAVYNNIYSIIIGKKYSATDLGYYDRGRNISGMFPVSFSDFITSSLLPIQSKMQDSRDGLLISYNKSVSLFCLTILPLCIFISAFATETIMILIGEKWLEASPITSILCIGYIFYPLNALNTNLLKVKAEGKVFMWTEILKKGIGIFCIFITVRFNLTIVAIGWTLCSLLEYIISVLSLKNILGKNVIYSIKELIWSSIRILVLVGACYCLSKIILNVYVRLIVCAVTFTLVFLSINIKSIKSVLR